MEPLASEMTMHMSGMPPPDSDGCGRELLQAVRPDTAAATTRSLAMLREGKSPSPEVTGQQLLMLSAAKLCIEVEEDMMERSSWCFGRSSAIFSIDLDSVS